MTKVKKLLPNLLLLITFIFFLLILFGLLFPINIKKPTTNLIKIAHIDSIQVESAKLHLPDKIKFKNLHLQNRLSRTHNLNIDIEKAHGNINLFYTLNNQEKLFQQLKGKFRWNFIQNKDYHIPFIFKQFSGEDTLLIPIFETLKVDNSNFIIDSLGCQIASFKNLNFNINTKKSNLPSFKIDLKCNNALLYQLKLEDIKTEIHIKKQKLSIPQITGEVGGGSFKFKDINIDPLTNNISTGSITVRKTKLEQMFKLDRGVISGTVDVNADVDSSFISLPQLKAKGNLSIQNLNAENIPLLRKVVKLTDIKSLEKVSFDKLEADFIIFDGKVHSDSIIATGKDFSLTGSGYIKPETQYFYYNVIGVFEKHMKDSVSTLVWDALLPMKDGRKYFKCLIEGTPKNPSVHLKREMVKSAAKSIFKSIKKDFKSLFN